MRHFHPGFSQSKINIFGPAAVSTRRFVGCCMLFVWAIPIRFLYVGFARNLTSTCSVANCVSLSTVVDASFFPSQKTIFTPFSEPWAICSYEHMRLGLLSLSLMTRISTFSHVSLGLSLFRSPPAWISKSPSCGRLFLPKKGFTGSRFDSSYSQGKE